MDLNTYLFLNKLTKTKFAIRVGMDRTYLHHILSGKHPASRNLAIRMSKATYGRTTPEEIIALFNCNREKLREMGIPERPEDPRQFDMLKEKS